MRTLAVHYSLYSHEHYTYTYTCRNISNKIKTSGHRSLEKYTSHFIERVRKGYEGYHYVRGELETEQNCNILTPTLMAITAFLSRFPGLLNRGSGDPASAGTWFSFQHLLSNSNCSIGGTEGPLCWVLVLSKASYPQLTRTSCAPS